MGDALMDNSFEEPLTAHNPEFIIRKKKRKLKPPPEPSSLAVIKQILGESDHQEEGKKQRKLIKRKKTIEGPVLPKTGITQAFAMKRPILIKEGTEYEPVQYAANAIYQTIPKSPLQEYTPRVVYDCNALSLTEGSDNFYDKLPPCYKASGNDMTLMFESRFESGNLQRVTQM